MWMQFESSSTGGVLLYAVGPEGSKGAAEGVFPSWGRPTDKRQQKLLMKRYEMKIDC
jgi:hypothetical protein